jgi:branched-chain amino acid transport system ATP-binding protein
VLRGVSLNVNPGEIVTLVGSNGAGKTTTLRNISRLLRPRAGTVVFDGKDLTRLASHQVVELGVVQVPEGRRVFPEMTVLENLRMGGYIKSARAEREKNLERGLTLFPRLRERVAQLAGTLSGGEQQMLAIARGLMARPRLLVLDEPSLGLSPLLVRTIFDTIVQINAQGTSVLLVEQNVYQSLRIAARGYVLETGRIALSGTGSELLSNDQVKAAFLGA